MELDQHHPVCANDGGFATFLQSRIHSSSADEGNIARLPMHTFMDRVYITCYHPSPAILMNIVEIENVTKTFDRHVAVNALSLAVPQGSIYGFIGPNGSGKTTTLRMIMRIYHPDPGAGVIRVLGETTSTAADDRVGYLPEERGLYKKMKVREVLRFYASLKGLNDSNSMIDSWLAKMSLIEWADKKVETLSKGMSQKVQFIAAVVAEPKLVILDEPFSGSILSMPMSCGSPCWICVARERR
jgi:ABC-type transporter Mla maintaining outer membrane lipid asymmetry ATPase subunit MlaF